MMNCSSQGGVAGNGMPFQHFETGGDVIGNFSPDDIQAVVDAMPSYVRKNPGNSASIPPMLPLRGSAQSAPVPQRKPPVPDSGTFVPQRKPEPPVSVGIGDSEMDFRRGGVVQHFADGGFVNSSVPGRTDRIPTSVASDSYVLPADIISGLGQGNSLAGAHIMDMILKTGPYGTNLQPHRTGNNIPKPPAPYNENTALAKGGKAHKADVVIAGGEYLVKPETVFRIGNGSMARGHKILDDFCLKMRAHNIKTQQKLPRPKR